MKMKDVKTLITSGTIILAFILYITFSDRVENKDTSVEESVVVTEINEKIVISSDYAQQITGNQLRTVKFLNANDGDTINIEVDGKKQRVRLLMVDTPEMNYDDNNPMPYAEAAKEFTINALKNGEKIELLFDKGPETDHYDRLLAYIFVDGKLLQESLLENGFATLRYINKPNNSLEADLREIQNKAEKANVNIWSIENYVQNDRFNENIK